jgi:hypothetical protein
MQLVQPSLNRLAIAERRRLATLNRPRVVKRSAKSFGLPLDRPTRSRNEPCMHLLGLVPI